MALGRRGFLGAMLAAPVAGKAAAQQAADMALNASRASSHGLIDGGMAVSGGTWDEGAFLKKRLEAILLRRSKIGEMVREKRRTITRLDPDLAANRSMSMDTRIRIQARRDAEAELDEEQANILRRAAEIGATFIKDLVRG